MQDDLDSNYRGAFDGHLSFGRAPALLIVDLAVAYVEEGSPLFIGTDAPLESNRRLIAGARATGTPVIFTRVEYQRGGADGGHFFRKVPALRCFETGSPLGEFPASASPEPGDIVVTKQYASAFFGTSLASSLNVMGIDTLLITGFSTSGCVRATALDALQHGLVPFVVSDACGDRHPAPHQANLFDLQAKYAEVVDEAEALRLLRNDVNWPERVSNVPL
ncbi:isochorismatase family protein [Rhizorhabdus wittichii]|uniref:Isochorismatase family protein n=1 Tax=Rhizorhabdus wittichii TaxID=160791 RepID=A0A975CZJ4_9SPHN|nr:isochorismatase family protein [Rhizorhabdus wittichii]QTH20178.1 isochorismatase family protein [Rhizorhabdus wittichii]